MTEALLALGFETDRLKTGTPARVDKRSIDFTRLEAQPGDEQVKWFSFDEEVRPGSGIQSCCQFCCIAVGTCSISVSAEHAVSASQSD